MRLTAFTDYALRALMRLAHEPSRVFTTEEIAREFSISKNHLSKIVQSLAAGGFVVTKRGPMGGFTLAKPPAKISVGDVVRHLEVRYAIVECFKADGGACVLTVRCRLKSALKRAADAFLTELDKTSLAECAYPGPVSASSRKSMSRASSDVRD
jgi:Rrf2 family transcriptional regulator, nitric oxide-sensitive transcriptional repressor